MLVVFIFNASCVLYHTIWYLWSRANRVKFFRTPASDMSGRLPAYFDQRCSEWSIQGFLDECTLEPFTKKIDSYIKGLRAIADEECGKRCERAKQLLDRYKKGSVIHSKAGRN